MDFATLDAAISHHFDDPGSRRAAQPRALVVAHKVCCGRPWSICSQLLSWLWLLRLDTTLLWKVGPCSAATLLSRLPQLAQGKSHMRPASLPSHMASFDAALYSLHRAR